MKNILGFLVLLAVIGFVIDQCDDSKENSTRLASVPAENTEVDEEKDINFPFVEIIEETYEDGYDTDCLDEENPCNCYDYVEGTVIKLSSPEQRISEIYAEILRALGIQGKAWKLCMAEDLIDASAYATDIRGMHYTVYNKASFSRYSDAHIRYVLAHEVTHSKENHTQKRRNGQWHHTIESETEADRGAGFILYLLGMSREDVMDAILPWVGGISDTHPVGQDLIDAVMGGYQEAEALYGRLDDRGGRSDGTAYEIANEWEIEALVHSYLKYIGNGDLKRAYTYHEGYSWLDEFEDDEAWVEEYWDDNELVDFKDEEVNNMKDEDAGLYDGIKTLEFVTHPSLLDVCQIIEGQCQGGRVVVKYIIHYNKDDKRYDECYSSGTMINEVFWVEKRAQSLHGYQIVRSQIMTEDCAINT